MKMVIKYARKGAARFISHLDMQRTFFRAIRRANLKAAYSKGFNPHIVMSFASPLSVGYETMADYIEVAMQEEELQTQTVLRLNSILPEDIRVIEVFAIKDSNKKLMSLNHSAKYSITFTFENDAECGRIISATKKIAESENYVTKDRKGKEVDIVPLILQMGWVDNVITLTLMNSSERALNPAVVANAIMNEAEVAAQFSICRIECYAKTEGRVVPFSALSQK